SRIPNFHRFIRIPSTYFRIAGAAAGPHRGPMRACNLDRSNGDGDAADRHRLERRRSRHPRYRLPAEPDATAAFTESSSQRLSLEGVG
ncbi:MAG: hypothetical protein Q8K79_05555, partial [Solirubrobacteraceae bacterium]|nr:hypothetical protein [Solirubrobacteraceae bacterium]